MKRTYTKGPSAELFVVAARAARDFDTLCINVGMRSATVKQRLRTYRNQGVDLPVLKGERQRGVNVEALNAQTTQTTTN